MHNSLTLVFLIFLFLSQLTATEEKFFPKPGTHFGVFYYPEHWPEAQRERDIKKVAELGFEFIHYNEFAWARLEPAEGKLDFDWLDKAISLAHENGLKVLLCTPSPCPPAWLAEKHPEILRMNDAGDSLSHRLGCGMEFSLGSEVTASVSGYTGLMELQPGQINWGRFNAVPLPGAVRMWVWHAFGMGERFVSTYRFRQPLFGTEQFHHGIMQTDGVSVSFGGRDFVRAVNEINQIEKHLDVDATDDFVEKTRT